MEPQLTLTNDYVFKYIFGREENKDCLLDLVNAVLTDSGEDPVVKLTLKNPVNHRISARSKETVLDVRAMDTSGRIFDLEVQVRRDVHFAKRSLYYWAQIYSKQINKGNKYKELMPVVCINLLDFRLFGTIRKRHTCFMLCEKDDPELVMTDDLMIHFIELPKTGKLKPRLELWTKALRKIGQEDTEMKVLFKNDPIMSKVKEAFDHFHEDPDGWHEALSREKWRRDMDSRLDDAHERGLEEGQVKGEAKGEHARAVLVVRNCMVEGFSTEQAARLSGLTIEEVSKMYTQE